MVSSSYLQRTEAKLGNANLSFYTVGPELKPLCKLCGPLNKATSPKLSYKLELHVNEVEN